jgi:hypothetical protein
VVTVKKPDNCHFLWLGLKIKTFTTRFLNNLANNTMGNQDSETANPKLPNYQYHKAQYHPVEEYLVTSTEKLTSETPSFVLEVTWPRVALFYHPASTLCIHLRDMYVAVAREIRRRSIRAPVEFWAVSCEVHRDACDDLGVTAVPRILAFPKGRIDGILVPRTSANSIEVDSIVEILGVTLKDLDEEEEQQRKEKIDEEDTEDESAKLHEIEERAKAANDPYQMHIEETDHLREILHPHSDVSNLFTDAMASLLKSIDGATKKGSNGDIQPWSWVEYLAFREWLDLLHWCLPTRDMAKVHNIVNDLRSNVETIRDRPDEITRILASHEYYKRKSELKISCGEKISCGFWKLLHVISIGVVEQHQSVLGDLERIRVFHVATTIRDFIQHFGFIDDNDAKEILLESFQDCFEDQKCTKRLGTNSQFFLSRLNRRKLPPKTDKSWKELAILVWKVHQEFHMNKLSTISEKMVTAITMAESQWPSRSQCPQCYRQGVSGLSLMNSIPTDDTYSFDVRSDITWDKEKVFGVLKHKYWPRTLQSPRVVVLDRWSSNENISMTLDSGFFWTQITFLVAFCLAGFFAWWKQRRRNFRVTPQKGLALDPGISTQSDFNFSGSRQINEGFQRRRRKISVTNTRFRSNGRQFLDD